MFKISRLYEDIIRVEFGNDWDADHDSGEMFSRLLEELDNSIEMVTLLIVAGDNRPTYGDMRSAWAILLHDELKQIVVVASHAHQAIKHMGAARGERGLPPLPMFACETEKEALEKLSQRVLP